MILDSHIVEKIKTHALSEFPKECCGLISGGDYHPCVNLSSTPIKHFRINTKEWARCAPVEAVVHSHTFTADREPTPDDVFALDCPSALDMERQIQTAVPWIIVSTDGKVCLAPFAFGDQVPMAPIKRRIFRHGVHDCYEIVRDVYRLGRDALAQQGIPNWPFEPRPKPQFPRSYGWWRTGQDLYRDGFAKAGFVDIGKTTNLRPGDVLLATVGRSPVPNHGAIYIGDGLIVHHMMHQLSLAEPVGRWFRGFVQTCLRDAG